MSKLVAQGCSEQSSPLFCFRVVELRCTVAAMIVRHPLAERMASVNSKSPYVNQTTRVGSSGGKERFTFFVTAAEGRSGSGSVLASIYKRATRCFQRVFIL